MKIQTQLIVLSVLIAWGMGSVTLLFTSGIGSLQAIDQEKATLITLADSVRDLSIAVNSLDSNQYRNEAKRFAAAIDRYEATASAVTGLQILPKLSPELQGALEIIGNMHGLITDDLKTLAGHYAALKGDLEKYLLESNSTSPRQFYTDDRLRRRTDLGSVYDRLEELVTGINGMTETLAGVIDTVQSQTQVIQDEIGKIRDRSIALSTGVSVVILLMIVAFSVVTGRSISRRVRRMQQGLARVADGDFTEAFAAEGKDEVAQVAVSVNNLLDSLNRLLHQVQQELTPLGATSQDLVGAMDQAVAATGRIQESLAHSKTSLDDETATINQLGEATVGLAEAVGRLGRAFEAQRRTLGESAAAVGEITAELATVSQDTEATVSSSSDLNRVSREGQEKINLVAKAVAQIDASSANLVQISSVIHDLADRTNLLAMNAAIEAARAGNQGRGFGVVAHEIQSLAEQASAQSRGISRDLEVVHESIAAIRGVTAQALEVFDQISRGTASVVEAVQRAQERVNRQVARGREVGLGIRRLDASNQDVDQALAGLRAVGEGIQGTTSRLLDHNGLLNRTNSEVLDQTQAIVLEVSRSGDLALSTKRQVETLEGETNRFRTRA